MDSQQAGMPNDEPLNNVDEVEGDGEEVEVTREELVTALQEVVQNLSDGLKGADRDTYASADDLAQNEWFFAGVSDEEGQYAVTMWPAEGDEEMLRIDIGSEDDVHKLASTPDMVSAMTDDFIDAMDDLDEEYEEYDDEDDEDDLEDDEEFDDEEAEDIDDIEDDEDSTISRDGNIPPR